MLSGVGAKLLQPSLMRSWVERDLHLGDLRALSNIASGRSFDGPDLDQVERLCKRGFLKTTARGTCRMTLSGWIATLLRYTFAKRARKEPRKRPNHNRPRSPYNLKNDPARWEKHRAGPGGRRP